MLFGGFADESTVKRWTAAVAGAFWAWLGRAGLGAYFPCPERISLCPFVPTAAAMLADISANPSRT
jgi:hypothetical protein